MRYTVRRDGQWVASEEFEMFREYFGKHEILTNGDIFILDERSSMQKAIKITKENQSPLEQQYNLDQWDLEDKVDYWLIADFGASRPEGYLTDTVFKETFDILESPKLQNDYVTIVPKGTYAGGE